MANNSDALRDALAGYLLNEIKGNAQGEVDPRVLAVARAFIKDNPPEDLPTNASPTGVLQEILDDLPFSAEGR